MKVFGVIGWKNSGKTGLMERLVAEIGARGFTVSTIKHAHHEFDVDQPGRDSFRHRAAGAQEVMLSSGKRWALMHELRGASEVGMPALLEKMSPVDLVLVEGFKTEAHQKLECHRAETGNDLIARTDNTVRLIASDANVFVDGVATLPLDDTNAITDFVLGAVGLI